MAWQNYSGYNRYRVEHKQGVDVNLEREPRMVQCCNCAAQFEKTSRVPGKHWCPDCRKLKSSITWQKRKVKRDDDTNRAV